MTQPGGRPQPEAGVPVRGVVGIRAQDRVTLAAGMVLGAGLLVAVRVLANALRTLRAALRVQRPPR